MTMDPGKLQGGSGVAAYVKSIAAYNTAITWPAMTGANRLDGWTLMSNGLIEPESLNFSVGINDDIVRVIGSHFPVERFVVDRTPMMSLDSADMSADGIAFALGANADSTHSDYIEVDLLDNVQLPRNSIVLEMPQTGDPSKIVQFLMPYTQVGGSADITFGFTHSTTPIDIHILRHASEPIVAMRVQK